MSRAVVDSIVKAVLYEGYMLYPYRPSAAKNQQRFNFGVVYPRSYSESQRGLDAWTMQTQCLLRSTDKTRCGARVRFLRMVARSIGKLATSAGDFSDLEELEVEKVARLEVGGKIYQSWQEAVEGEIVIAPFRITEVVSKAIELPFELCARSEREAIRDDSGCTVGVISREQQALTGVVEISAAALQPGLFRLTVLISNSTALRNENICRREDALHRSLVSAHTILEAGDGEFVSLIDPPEGFRESAATCRNVGTWPVLVGNEGDHDMILSSPIILYDYPQVAPESPGDLFDGAEIDEILSLRILTMTDDEKSEMRESDARARKILDRTESLPQEQWMKLHGVLRGLRSMNGETS